MGTKVKTFVGILAGCALFTGTTAAQTQSPSGPATLDKTVRLSLAERVQMPLAFATRDSAFVLSLPQDEPAEVYVQLTVGKNGKVKEKLTRVNANHIAGYVAPAFIEGAKGLSIDRALLAGMVGKDTALTVTLPIEYQCVLDTMNKAWPGSEPRFIRFGSRYDSGVPQDPQIREKDQIGDAMHGLYDAQWKYKHSDPTRIWYYLAFLKDQPE